jgi:hypothetical protein
MKLRSVLVALLVTACSSASSPSDNPGDGSGSQAPGGPSVPGGNPAPGGMTPPGAGGNPPPAAASGAIKTVFLIMMENHSWGTIKASKSAGFINMIAQAGAHAENYYTPAGNHPSEPNYIWLEAGDNLNITDDNPPANNHQATKDHQTSQLEAKGISWKAYVEDMPAGICPLTATGLYDPTVRASSS